MAEQTVSLDDLGLAGVAGVPADRDVLAALLAGDDDPIAEQREKIDDADVVTLADNFRIIAALTRRKADLEDQVSKVSSELEAAKQRQLDMMKTQGTAQFRDAQGQGSCHIRDVWQSEIVDPEKFTAWVQENHPHLLSVNANTRGSLLVQEFKNKGVAPDDIEKLPPGVKVTARPQLGLNGVKPKKEKKNG
jgi:hypothetical protein